MRSFDRVLNDADIMVYAQAFVLEPKDGQSRQPLLAGVYGMRATTYNLKKRFGAKELIHCMTGGGNFREAVAVTKPYKDTRKKEKPHWFYDLRKACEEDLGSIVVHGEEADDWLSYTALQDTDNTVTVTVDKDALNTTGWYYNPRKDELVFIDKDTANYNFWYQMLIGDTVDNIAGLPSYGKVTAKKLLEVGMSYHELECLVGLHYAMNPKVDDPEAYMTEMGLLLWMRREPNQMWRIGLYD